MEIATHQILGFILLYFLIGYIISIRVVKGVRDEREKSLLRSKKIPSDGFVTRLMLFLWPIVIILTLFKNIIK